MNRSLVPALLGCVCAASMAMGSTAYGTSALGELTGSRDLTNVTVAGTFSLFDISWAITLSGGIYHYTYTITGPSGPGLGVSHFALNLSNDCVAGGSCVTSATMNVVADETLLIYGANTSANGDTNFPGSFYGVRFFPAVVPTQLPIVITFDSTHAPVYGDFYLKLGNGGPSNGASAWNNGSNLPSNTSALITDYIPTPGVIASVPEAGSVVLCGIGLAAIGLVGWQRRRRRDCAMLTER